MPSGLTEQPGRTPRGSGHGGQQDTGPGRRTPPRMDRPASQPALGLTAAKYGEWCKVRAGRPRKPAGSEQETGDSQRPQRRAPGVQAVPPPPHSPANNTAPPLSIPPFLPRSPLAPVSFLSINYTTPAALAAEGRYLPDKKRKTNGR